MKRLLFTLLLLPCFLYPQAKQRHMYVDTTDSWLTNKYLIRSSIVEILGKLAVDSIYNPLGALVIPDSVSITGQIEGKSNAFIGSTNTFSTGLYNFILGNHNIFSTADSAQYAFGNRMRFTQPNTMGIGLFGGTPAITEIDTIPYGNVIWVNRAPFLSTENSTNQFSDANLYLFHQQTADTTMYSMTAQKQTAGYRNGQADFLFFRWAGTRTSQFGIGGTSTRWINWLRYVASDNTIHFNYAKGEQGGLSLSYGGVSIDNGGLHIGGTSDAGDNNLLVDGTITGSANIISNDGSSNHITTISRGNSDTNPFLSSTSLAIGQASNFGWYFTDRATEGDFVIKRLNSSTSGVETFRLARASDAATFPGTLGVTGTSALATVNASGKLTLTGTANQFDIAPSSSVQALAYLTANLTTTTTLGGKDSRIVLINNSSTVNAGGEIVVGATADAAAKRYFAIGTDITENTGSGAYGSFYIAGKATSASTSLTRYLTIDQAGAVSIPGTLGVTGVVTFGAQARLKGYTVATLPAGTQGDLAFVTDALAPAYHVAVVGGGAVVVPVFYNGVAWIVN